MLQQTVLQTVELYPYIEYMKFLLPGSITLAIFMSVMIGGGMLYIDDKARGVHEGYLVTPITKAELVLGLNASSAIKAVMTGTVITFIGSLLSGVGTLFHFSTAIGLLIMIMLTALALNTMMFLIVVRVEDPLVPRAIFGILNTLLFFPSGAVYPIQAFPWWLRGIASVDPFSFAVHGFKSLLLKEAGLSAILPDMLYLSLFAAIRWVWRRHYSSERCRKHRGLLPQRGPGFYLRSRILYAENVMTLLDAKQYDPSRDRRRNLRILPSSLY